MTTRRWLTYVGVLVFVTSGTVATIYKVRNAWRGAPNSVAQKGDDKKSAEPRSFETLKAIPLAPEESYTARESGGGDPFRKPRGLPDVEFAPQETRSYPAARVNYESPASASATANPNSGGGYQAAETSPYNGALSPADEQPPAPLAPPPASFQPGDASPQRPETSAPGGAYDPSYSAAAAPGTERPAADATTYNPRDPQSNSASTNQLDATNRLRDSLPTQTAPVHPAARLGEPIDIPADATPIANSSPAANAAPLVPAETGSGSNPRNLGAGAGIGERASSSGLSELPGKLTGTGAPGSRHLEGPQTPSLVLEKVAPQEIQVGKPVSFQIKVRNVGQAPAEQVVVNDQVPRGTRLVDTSPRAVRSGDGSLAWQIGAIPAGGESTLVMQVVPEQEGEIGSVATVSFQAQISVRTVSTKPQLVVEHEAPATVLIGETARLVVRIANRGTGAATGLVIEEDVPAALSHAAGRELEYEIGTLRPGEERRLELMLRAERPGVVENVLVIRGEGGLLTEDRAKIEVVAPQLELGITGPKVRYLERPATYAVALSNPGTANAKDVELVAHLPRGLKFVSANQQGQYDPQTHAVFWSLAELPAKQAGQVEVTTLPIEQGEHKLRVEGKGLGGLASQSEQVIAVEGLAAIFFEVTDMADPIEVGKDTVYQVKVLNQGSKAATNVQLVATLPPELKPIAGEGPTKVSVEGTRAVFEALPRLGPGETAIFKLQARGVKSGDLRIRMQITTAELAAPVTKEESTRVYADE